MGLAAVAVLTMCALTPTTGIIVAASQRAATGLYGTIGSPLMVDTVVLGGYDQRRIAEETLREEKGAAANSVFFLAVSTLPNHTVLVQIWVIRCDEEIQLRQTDRTLNSPLSSILYSALPPSTS